MNTWKKKQLSFGKIIDSYVDLLNIKNNRRNNRIVIMITSLKLTAKLIQGDIDEYKVLQSTY